MELISPDTRRTEPDADAPHFHIWTDRGFVLIAQRPRFPSRQAARNLALRKGMEKGTFIVRACGLPCRFTQKEPKRTRKPRRHCTCCNGVKGTNRNPNREAS